MNTVRFLTMLMAMLVLGLHGFARADASTDAKAEASAHFKRGVELFQEEAFRAALVEFERANEIAPDYRLLYNIGQTKLRLQDYLGVVQAYETYLTTGGASVPAERRAQVEEALIALRDRVGRLSITSNRADVEIVIDDVAAGKTPFAGTLPVNVGRHRVLARASDGVQDTRLVSVAGGDVVEVSFQLSSAPEVARKSEDKGWSRMRKGAVATWSVGAALLAGSAVTGVLTLNTQSDVDDMLDKEGITSGPLDDKQNKLQTLALTTDVLIGVGAASVVVGTVLWLVDRRAQRADEKSEKPAKLSLQLGPSSAALRGTF